MKVLSRRILLPIATVLCVCVPNAARAQAPLEPAQMSPRTLFYLAWRGVPSPEFERRTRCSRCGTMLILLRCVRRWRRGCWGLRRKNRGSRKLRRSNSRNSRGCWKFVHGRICERAGEAKSFEWSRMCGCKDAGFGNGMFFVYDPHRKEMLLTKAILLMRASAKEPPRLSQSRSEEFQFSRMKARAAQRIGRSVGSMR